MGYDKSSPAFLVFHPDIGKVLKHRLVKCVDKVNVEKQTQDLHEDTEKPQEQNVRSRTPKDNTFDEFDCEESRQIIHLQAEGIL